MPPLHLYRLVAAPMEAVSGLFQALDGSPTLLGTSASCRVFPPQSFHFTISCNSSFTSDTPSNAYALFLLPVSLFVDRYELNQRFVDGEGPRAQVWGETNLELPVASPKLNPAGSAVLLALQGKHYNQFHMPLHARYLLPVEADDTRGVIAVIDVPLPRLFASDGEQCLFNCHHLLCNPTFFPFRPYPTF